MDFEPGTALGSYVVQERVSAGGMAVVYRALHQTLGREVALKVLSPELVNQTGFMQRFINEARTVAQLDHPNILPVFDFGSINEVTFLTMPLVKGGTLRNLMDRGAMDPGSAWRYLREVSKALQYAHENGVVHRDVKPTNVLIHTDGRGLLADFGLARSMARPSNLSGVGIAIGTPGYMAPEQAMGANVDHRADIYALGVMVFEMLTGTMPYRLNTQMGVVMATVQAPIPSAVERNPRLPQELDRVLGKALAKRAEDRQQSARELLEELRHVPFGVPMNTPGMLQAGTFPTLGANGAAEMVPAVPARLGAHGIPGALPAAFTSPDAYTVSTPPALRTGAEAAPVATAIPMPGAVAVEVARALNNTPPPAAAGSAVMLLEQMGVRRRHAQQRFGQNAFFANAVTTARQVAGERWPYIVQMAALPEFLYQDPPDNLERTSQVDVLSRLNEAFEMVFASDAPEKLRQWGRAATERWLKVRKGSEIHQFRNGFIPGQQRKLGAMLKAYAAWMDSVRGEPLQAWKQIDEHQFWLLQYSNLFALGREKSEKSCHMWVSSLETLLRWGGLANDWLVDEVECGCVTRTYNCVFAIRSVKGSLS